ncbi:TetR/AcrR family transcriptional regulator [Nocardioides kongjuensis]|uniref:AcrR family transcriptional regulator n=1 Tax=Nocardioides kongjuensis TaxID=349522 RepID=A0A852R8I4_9ACTN|nr:helix-turn-helix domain-containing protein [Nocardioides kongjuensis]NYD29277.1 AcrR family transcriptional regulator [Nocardioides kongjuensis]
MTAGASRPGPRTDVDVRARLLDTAEELFAANGVGTDSLRAIGRAAGVSSAGVLYHFPRRQDLVDAVVARRGEPLTRSMRSGLAALVERTEPVTTRDVVDAVLLPMVAMIAADPKAGLSWMKLITQLANHRAAAWADLDDGEPSASELFHAAAVRALRDYESTAVRFRLGIAMFSMLASLAGADQGKPEGKIGPAGLDPVFVDELARFTAAGLAAER